MGEGNIKKDAKGRGDNLTVKSGQKIDIIRMDNCPSNKWLVKVDNMIGYVDSSNIEVNPSTIKQTMRKHSSLNSMGSAEEIDGQVYDLPPEEDEDNIYQPLD